MRRQWSRVVVGAALIAGLAGLGSAADVSDDEFKTLVDADAKLIAKAAEAGEKGTAAAKKNALKGIHSTALYVATYANGRSATDAKAAGVRDQALKIVAAAKKKDFKAAGELAKDLASPAAAGKAGKIDVAKAAGLEEGDVDLVMSHFAKAVNFGSGAEEDIKKFGTKKGPAPKKEPAKKETAKTDAKADAARAEAATAIALRVLAMADLNKTVVKGENAAAKKDWADFNAKMAQAAEDLLKAAKGKNDPTALATAFTAVEGSCNKCHSTFK